MFLLLSAALAASPWRDMSADLHAEVTLALPAEQVRAALADLSVAQGLFDRDCVQDWVVGIPASGPGAMARATYVPSWMHRRLTLTVKRADPGAVVWDHLGDRGFVTTFNLLPAEGGTLVKVDVPLNLPPWPLGKVYHLKIKPEWQACYVAALRQIGKGT